MAFDSQTRNRLARFVADARKLITDEFTEKFQSLYGLSPSGEITPLADLRHLDEEQKAAAERLRARLHHLEPGAKNTDRVKPDTIEHLTREQAFTVLNRLAAIRMAEKRGIIIESVGRGYESKGFKVYLQVAGNALGDTYHKYRRYLFCLFDELAVDLGTLFDRRSSAGLLFLREPALLQLLEVLNAPDLESLWAEDEAIGWIYQYYNDPAERKKMREQSSAPQNSRELAVRNQFFTPRYVVEFLTDNTLGRLWHEMTKGQSRLKEECHYLVRQPDEVFLDPFGDDADQACGWLQGNKGPMPDFWALALTVNAYFRAGDAGEASDAWVEMRLPRVTEGQVNDFSTQELLDLLFLFCRKDRFCEGTLDGLHKEVQLILRTIQKRVESPQRTDLSQEALLRQPVFIKPRALKDPREIRMLDPACGSMHFGLYSFDLFEVIYDEAWDIAHGRDGIWKSLETFAPFVDFVAQYPDKASFLREVPRFIIERNIHGIDIDERCAQIAGLSLWLRAQRTWQQQHLEPFERPQIRRSNIVCAEPMPGEESFLNEFIEEQFSGSSEKNLLGQLVRRVFEAMKLAGEAGSLLKIEEEIAGVVAEAKRKWLAGPKLEQGRLFADETVPPAQKDLGLDVTGITDDSFWEKAEERIYAALQAYAEQADHGGGYQRRLFADDAARGFAFIDLCRKRYDVVLMNPPFGVAAIGTRDYLSEAYPDTKYDLFAMFVSAWLDRLVDRGLLAAITNKTGFFLQTFEKWRRTITSAPNALVSSVDLGFGVLDAAVVETMAYVIAKHPVLDSERCIFIRLAEHPDKPEALFDVIKHLEVGKPHSLIWIRSTHEFDGVPHRPLCYWASREFLRLFETYPQFAPKSGHIYQGIATGDNFRFLRNRWEVSSASLSSKDWVTYAKGGTSVLYFANFPLVVLWSQNGSEIKANAQRWYGSASRTVKNEHVYFRAGLTYTQVTVKGLFVRALPEGCVFDMKGPSVITDHNLKVTLGVFCSLPTRVLAKLITDCRQWHPTNLMRLPVPKLSSDDASRLEEKVATLVRHNQSCLTADETSSGFVCPGAIPAYGPALANSQSAIDQIVAEGFGVAISDFRELDALLRSIAEGVTEEDDDDCPVKQQTLVAFISYALGVVFGRWDVRYATSARAVPELPDPFAPLSVCPPGQLQSEKRLPLSREDIQRLRSAERWHYPLDIAWDGILVDDRGHSMDVETRVLEVLQIIWKDRWETLEREACEILGVPTLRDHFRKPAAFFADHLKCYSKSRRQAPIYWPLSTASGSYTLWVYYHRLTDQTLHTALADFVDPKIKTVELDAQRHKNEGRTQRYGESIEFLDELKELRAEIERIIKLPWKPNLNDGVLITASPLWKLFRFGKWQKDLKACWEDLEGGKYDWAHLAFSIWPDRVREKCEIDRSLAIAHALEELCTVQAPKPKKGKTPKKNAIEEQGEKSLKAEVDLDIAPKPAKEPKASAVQDFEPRPIPIDQTDRTEVLCTIRQVFGDSEARDRDSAIRDVAAALGYQRVGPRIREVLHTDLLTAVRRGILQNKNGQLSLLARDLRDYQRDFLKKNFLSAIGRTWIERADAIQAFARWLGFSRTGSVIEETGYSLINGLLRDRHLEADKSQIRRATG
jgi:hypothetical protein